MKRVPCAVVLLLIAVSAMQAQPTSLLAQIDHLVYATPDLDLGVRTIEKTLGVRATPGGQHPGMGTRNALVALGPTSYLEIIGPDPDQPAPVGGRPFRIDSLRAPALVAWAAKGERLDALVAAARRRHVMLGDVIAGQRARPDGIVLRWRYSDPKAVVADGLVPFFIDWGASPHPARSAVRGAELVALLAEHPQPAGVRAALAGIGVPLRVDRGSRPAIVATIVCPRGRVELR
jgi:glyoxalase-like protein